MVKSIIDVIEQIEVYKKHKNEIFQSNWKAKPYSNDIYKVLVSELQGMSEKSIQMSINRNIKEIWADQQVSIRIIK